MGDDWEEEAKPGPAEAEAGDQPGRGRGRAQGRGGRGRSRPGKDPCLCCSEPRVSNSRFCTVHKRSSDNLRWQSENSGDPEAEALFKQKFAEDDVARQMTIDFTRENPPDQKYKRKKLMDWAAFKQQHGVKTAHKEKIKDKPMTEKAFKIWATTKEGLSSEAAAALIRTHAT